MVLTPKNDSQASSSISSGIYRYCGDPKKFAFRLMIEETGIQIHGAHIDRSRSKVSLGENESTHFLPMSVPIQDESFYQGSNQKSIYNSTLGDPSKLIEYLIRWDTTNPTVEKLQSNLDKLNLNHERDDCSILKKSYMLGAKMVHNKYHPTSSKTYTLHQQVKWNETSSIKLDGSLEFHDVLSSKLYNHDQNSAFNYKNPISHNDSSNIISNIDNRNQIPMSNGNKLKTMCIILERILDSTTIVDLNKSPSEAPFGSMSNLIAQPPTSTQNFESNASSFIADLKPHQHVLGLITFDEQSRLIIVKPDFGFHLDFNSPSSGHSIPKFTYRFGLTSTDNHARIIDSSGNVLSPIEAKINLVRHLLRPQLNQTHRPRTKSKKVFSSPINGSILTHIQLNIQYAHSIFPVKIDNLYIRYRLFSQAAMNIQSLDNGIGANILNDIELNCNSKSLYLDGTTITSIPNDSGRYHFSCIEQLLIESKKTQQEQQLDLLMEFYSCDFYKKRLEGWSFVTLPRSNPIRNIEVDIIHYDLYRLVDRLRYHLLGTLPKNVISTEKIVLSNNRYLMPTRSVGKLIFTYEAVQQFSDPSLDKAAIELLKINDVGTRLIKIDIESVIQAYKQARNKLEALEC